jgi:hypothetical protein
MEQQLSRYFTRTEPLGLDRHFNVYWVFEGDTRVFVETRVSTHALEVKRRKLEQDDSVTENSCSSKEYTTTGSHVPRAGSDSPYGLDMIDGSRVPSKRVARAALEKLTQPPLPSQVRSTWLIYGTSSVCKAWRIRALDRPKFVPCRIYTLYARCSMTEGHESEI